MKTDYEADKARKNRRKKLERELSEIENQILVLEKEIRALEEESMKIEIYSDISKITKVMEEKKNKEKDKERVEERWLEITEELENGQDN